MANVEGFLVAAEQNVGRTKIMAARSNEEKLTNEKVYVVLPNFFTAPAPHKPCSGFTQVTAAGSLSRPQAIFVTRLHPRTVARTSRSSAIGSIDNYPGGFFR
jgi:hypothetical protein